MLATKYTGWQPGRAHSVLWQALISYHTLEWDGLGPPDDKLAVQHVPLEEARYARSVELKVDLERAHLGCGASYREKMITWEYLTAGADWHYRKAEKWDVSRTDAEMIAERTVWKMVDWLTGKREG